MQCMADNYTYEYYFVGVLVLSCRTHTHTNGNQTAREQSLVIAFIILIATEVKQNV